MKKFISTLAIALTLTLSGFATGGENSGCPVSDYRTYHENGQIRLDAHINCDNEFHGVFIEYLDDGSVWGYGEYLNGLRHGTWVVFDIHQSGQGMYVSLYENGELISAKRLETTDAHVYDLVKSEE